MTRKKFFLILLLTLFFYNFGYSDFGYRASKISIVLSESDIVFVGKVNKVEVTMSKYTSYVEVVEMLKGSAGDKNIILNSKIINGALAEDEAYPQENNTYIFFCRKDGEGFVFTTTPLGILSAIAIDLPHVDDSFNRKDDIKLLLNAYYNNKELFSKAGKRNLFSLYSQLKSGYIKSRLLNDLEDLVDENDTEFFATGLKSNDVQYNLFSIAKAGTFKIEQLKETIDDLLKATPDIDINYNKIFQLLSALSRYADMKYKDVFFGYLSNREQAFRTISYHAIGILGDEKTILALVPYYEKEANMYLRGDILVALRNIKNNNVLIPILYQLREKETEELNISFIDDIIIGCTETNKPIYSEPIVITGNLTSEIPWIRHEITKISIVLIESDIIFIGKINHIRYPHSVDIEITEVLKGTTNAKEASFISNGDAYFDQDLTYIFFVRKDGDGYVFTTDEVSILSLIATDLPYLPESFYRKDDIKLLLDAYNTNKELFSKNGKQDLFRFWTQLKNIGDEVIKERVLADIYYLCDKQDIPVLLAWKQIETNMQVVNNIDGIIQMLEVEGRGK